MKKIIILLIAMSFFVPKVWGQKSNTVDVEASNKALIEKFKNENFQHRTDRKGFVEKSTNKRILDFKQKATKALTHRLDSMVSENHNASQWKKTDKNTFTYNAQGQLTESMYLHRDTIANKWISNDKVVYTYSGIHLISEEYSYHDGSAWENSSKYTYAYDSQGNLTEEINVEWDGSAWANYEKYTYTYNANGNITVSEYFTWDDVLNQWNMDTKNENTFSGGYLVETLSYYWDLSAWVPFSKIEFKNDSNGKVTETIIFWWDGSNWEGLYKSNNTYSSAGHLVSTVDSNWNSSLMLWEPSSETQMSYDVHGNTMEEIYRYWDAVNNAWGNNFKSNYSVDVNVLLSNCAVPSYLKSEEIPFLHMPLDFVGSIWDGTQWVADIKQTLYYSQVNIVGAEADKMLSFEVYPNPAKNVITIEGNENPTHIELIDITGKIVMEEDFKEKTTLKVEGVNQGIYILKLTQNKESNTQKIIIQ